VRGGELDAVGEGEGEDPVRFGAGRAGAIWERERAVARGQVGASRFGIWARVSILVVQANICPGDECKRARKLNMRARVGPIYFWRQTD